MLQLLPQRFVKRCINGETFRYIANDYSVDGKTVAKAFNDYADAHRDEAVLTYTPVVLGIDEAHIDDHYRLVLTDIHKQKLLDINNPAPDKFNYKKAVYLKKGEKPIFRQKQEVLYDVAFKFESVGVDVKPISAYNRMLVMSHPDRMLAYVQAVSRVHRGNG